MKRSIGIKRHLPYGTPEEYEEQQVYGCIYDTPAIVKQEEKRSPPSVTVRAPPASPCVESLDPHEDENTFFHFIDLLAAFPEDEKGFGFFHNRTTLLRHYVRGNFYVVHDWSFYKEENTSGLPDPREFGCNPGIVPAFLAVSPGQDDAILWVHPTYRRQGYGSLLVKKNAEDMKTVYPLETSIPFWTALGYHTISQTKYKRREMHLLQK